MLSYSFKILWFVLSFSGMLGCWAVLIAFAHAVETYWAPIVYCIGVTILEGMFCLGMIWRMDPFLMPKSFCIAQTVLMGFSTFLLTGVSTAFSLATSLCVSKPKAWGDNGKGALRWRTRYLFPIVVFPLLASTIQIVVVLKLHAAQPSNELHCDASAPVWVRFLSYAGTPFLLSLPCFYLSVMSAIRVFRTHSHLRRSWYPNTSIDDLTPVPTRRRRLGIKKFLPHAITTPFGSIDNPNASHTSVALEMGRPVSPGFPTFTPTSRTPAASDTCEVTRVEINPVDKVQGQDDRRPSTAATESSYISDVKEDPGERKSTFDSEASVGGDGDVTDDRKYGGFESKQAPNIPHKLSQKSRRPPPPNLAPAIWRIILFQFLFITVMSLASISTFIAVFAEREPTPIGTQHVALLLAAWGPVILFGHLPVVRTHMIFWRSK